jgi:hypothetical protein
MAAPLAPVARVVPVLVVVEFFHVLAGGALVEVLAVADAQVMAESLVAPVDVLVPADRHDTDLIKKTRIEGR